MTFKNYYFNLRFVKRKENVEERHKLAVQSGYI